MYDSLKIIIPYCLVVRISGFHPEGPGSIPGMGNLFNFLIKLITHQFILIDLILVDLNGKQNFFLYWCVCVCVCVCVFVCVCVCLLVYVAFVIFVQLCRVTRIACQPHGRRRGHQTKKRN